MDEGCTQPLSSDPMIHLNTTIVFFLIFFLVCEESPQLGVSRPYNKDQSESTRVREASNTHKSAAIRTHTAKTRARMNRNKFTTRTELKSLRKSIKCAETECGRFRMLKVCLGDSSMRLGVPFIAPRQLGAVGTQQGRQFLPSDGWRTRQPGAPPDSHCSMSGADLLPFLAQPSVRSSGWLAHRTLSGAHRTVRCLQPTVGWGHASRADCTADRCAGSRWLTGQSGAPPDNPVNYIRTPLKISQEWPVRRSCPGAPDTVRCTQTEQQLAVHSQLFSNPFLFLILALRQIY
jgi:hypothetical protein